MNHHYHCTVHVRVTNCTSVQSLPSQNIPIAHRGCKSADVVEAKPESVAAEPFPERYGSCGAGGHILWQNILPAAGASLEATTRRQCRHHDRCCLPIIRSLRQVFASFACPRGDYCKQRGSVLERVTRHVSVLLTINAVPSGRCEGTDACLCTL